MELTLEAALQKGIDAHRAGKIIEAKSLYTEILNAQPKHPHANHNMGLIAISVGKMREALLFFKLALESNPSISQFWVSYIETLIKLDQITDAEVMLDQAKGRGVKEETLSQLEKILSEKKINKTKIQQPPREELELVVSLYHQGRLQQALTNANKMLKKFSHSATLYNIAGVCYTGLMQYDKALNSCKYALKIRPDYAEAHNNIGIALKGKKQLGLAIESFKQAIKVKPDFAEAYNNMGIAINDKGDECDKDAALDSCRQAVKIKPNFAEAHNNIGIILHAKDDIPAAVDSFNKALTVNPNYADAHKNMGIALNDKGNLEAAIESFKQAIKIKPDHAEAHNHMAVALNNTSIAQHSMTARLAAIDSFKQAIMIRADYTEAHYNLGLLLLEAGQYGEAAKHFKLGDFKNSGHYLLRCLYLQDEKSLFYDQLDYLEKKGEVHPIIGSLGCRSALKYGIERPNLFCIDPLNYVLTTKLSHQYDFEKVFIKTANKILNEKKIPNKKQGLLTNGFQTAGNVFKLEPELTKEIEKIIRFEVEKYLVKFKDSQEGFITNWPKDYYISGWFITMTSGGKISPHMHENGWMSGSIYIKIPSKLISNSGNLVLCIEDGNLADRSINQEKSISVAQGTLCLFPASLLHYTIPFESKEERIVLAFDIKPPE